MTDNGIAEEEFTDHGEEELVVDLPYVRFVADRIGSLGGKARVNANKTDSLLGLGVVTVENIEDLAATIRARPKDPADRYPPRGEPRTNIGVILSELRRQIRNDHN